MNRLKEARLERLLTLIAAALVFFLQPIEADGAEITTVLDSFVDSKDILDIDIGVGYSWHRYTGLITREFICDNSPICPNKKTILDVKELNYKRVVHTLDIVPRIGLYENLELAIMLPLVLSDKTSLNFAGGVDGGNSSIDPDSGQSLFQVPNDGQDRSGFGDMSLAVRYSPFSQEEDFFYPSWVVGLKYTIPTGSVKKAGNSGVGHGLHQLTLDTSISRRFFIFEPYFGFWGTFKFPSGSSLFKNYGMTQTKIDPGNELGLFLGMEIVPWESKSRKKFFSAYPSVTHPYTGVKGEEVEKDEEYLSLDFGITAKYVFAGRDYTPIFDALGSSDCDPAKGCALTSYTRTEKDTAQKNIKSDGITDVEGFGSFGGYAGFSFQPVKYLNLSFKFFYEREMSHYLTFADAGKDFDKSGFVEDKNSEGVNELSPVYIEEIDKVGKRIKSEGVNIFGISVMLSGRF